MKCNSFKLGYLKVMILKWINYWDHILWIILIFFFIIEKINIVMNLLENKTVNVWTATWSSVSPGCHQNLTLFLMFILALNVYIIHYPILKNDLLSFSSFNITWKARSIFKYTTRAAMLAYWEEGRVRIRILPREYTDPYAP